MKLTKVDDLHKKGLLIRTHGGAMLPENKALVRVLSNTLKEHEKEKYAICEKALSFISPEMNIIIDSGSTTVHLAKMVHSIPLSVITNSMLVVNELLDSEHVELFVSGGLLRKASLSLMGDPSSYFFSQIHADILFLGSSGFSIEKGVSCTNIIEAQTKKQMISHASKVVLLADSSKIGKMFIAHVCNWQEIDYFITDFLEDEQRIKLEALGVQVIIAKG
ncbi:MAG: DeoR/GlpR transcriptional regulator [Spirochaetia bacterium]|nr:DeoR/GlpR transcriptional regulator [Spirochaetia bacterium]